MTIRQAYAILGGGEDGQVDDDHHGNLGLHSSAELAADIEASNRGIDLRTRQELRDFIKVLDAEGWVSDTRG